MAELVTPDVRYQRSFLEAMDEFIAEGRRGDNSMVGHRLGAFGEQWHTAEGFAEYVAFEIADGLADTPRPADRVPSTNLWWVEGEEYLGRIAVRHRLNDFLRALGGHIGYDIRRSRRREGHATAMLRAALPRAHALGIDPALITCDTTNVASRRVIEACGGRLEDERSGKLRFWVPTA
ncbi:GNAT family N-acetyltransferase [Nocardioides terrisoli]|uniref:GNAT family N-acetyltransferase n=1 Tax=Nocardioides terrisoli TaxID=3388267 RepID=UPI00287BA3CC|nr:GNAT family N-acetyltransferase [Nocardioides marmorisolisilvae]